MFTHMQTDNWLSFNNSLQDEYFLKSIQIDKKSSRFFSIKQGVTSDGKILEEQNRMSRRRINKLYFSTLRDNFSALMHFLFL